MAKHPALQMSKVRQEVWINEASAEDFFDHLDLLVALYAKKVYKDKEKQGKYGKYDPDVLMAHYEEHKKHPTEVAGDDTKSW